MDKSERILNLILSQEFNAPTLNDFVVYDEKFHNFIIGDQIQPDQRCEEIIEWANELHANPLFQMLISEYEYHGTKRMAVQAGDWDGVRFPKAFIYGAALLKNKVNQLRNLKIEKKKVAKKETKKDE